MRLTGQQILAAAVHKAGGGAALVRLARMREFSDADGLGAQVLRWARGEVKPPGEAVLRSLNYMGVIDWDEVERLHRESVVATKARIAAKAAQARERAEQQSTDRPRQEEGEQRP